MVEDFAVTLAVTAVAVHKQQLHLSDGPHPFLVHLKFITPDHAGFLQGGSVNTDGIPSLCPATSCFI